MTSLLLLGDGDQDLGNTVDRWAKSGEISLEVGLDEEYIYTACETKTLYSSVKSSGDTMLCVPVHAHVCTC